MMNNRLVGSPTGAKVSEYPSTWKLIKCRLLNFWANAQSRLDSCLVASTTVSVQRLPHPFRQQIKIFTDTGRSCPRCPPEVGARGAAKNVVEHFVKFHRSLVSRGHEDDRSIDYDINIYINILLFIINYII